MKIFSKIFLKKKNLKNPHPSTIRCNYTCEDKNLEWSIRAYLIGFRTAKNCLQDFIETMAYRDCLHLKENETIFPLLEDFLDGASWKSKQSIDCGDYNPNNPKSWLSCIYNIYDNILLSINLAEAALNSQNKKITTEAVMQLITNTAVTREVYESKNTLSDRKEEIKSIIDKNEFTPKEALLLIKDNWHLLYPYQSSYEAIEYCIVCSENHTIPNYFDSAFRDLGYSLGPLYVKAKEK